MLYTMDFKMRRGGKRVNPESIDNYVAGVNERSQQRGNLKDEVYIP
ncbi:hypothetical protein Xinn_02175 [Xenorhabdus innexi]|uniref:Transposase n=1 Tax=Xenorhabdus innexi TaxID=290109 RepID=A0A2G0NLX5_9GAMM|nr:hypothetical protein Xinn_02175 [Xenorhabdus innexi]